MPARDVLWEPGMTLPDERMRALASELREGLGSIPRLSRDGASTDEIAQAVWEWMGTRSPSPAWGWQIADPADLARARSILGRGAVHWVTFDPQGLYADPMIGTMLVLFARELGELPEDVQYEASQATDPDSWNWNGTTARRVYRWRVKVTWKEPRPFVRLEQIMQVQKLRPETLKRPAEWLIYNKNGQNQLYALQPESGTWWSGADYSDWLDTHALEIADVMQGVAWALVSVVTLGAGSGAAAAVTTVRIAADVLKKLAIAAQMGTKIDMGDLFAELGQAGAALIQVPGVSDLVQEVGAWAEKAGQEALSLLPANGVFTSLISSGGGLAADIAREGSAIYSAAKGWYDRASDIIDAAGKLSDVRAEAGELLAVTGSSELETAFGVIFAHMKDALPKDIFEKAKLEVYGAAQAELTKRIADLHLEVLHARELLPAHLAPWFDRGKSGRTAPEDAPFYAVPAVQYGKGARELELAVLADLTRAKNAAEANLAFHDMIGRYGLLERYRLFSYLRQILPRYGAQFGAKKAEEAAKEPARKAFYAAQEAEIRRRGV